MPRLRISISKDEPLRFLGHLDFLRTMERALRRSQLPLAYSEGFNPHMKVSYDTALAVGMTADPFYMDVELTCRTDPAAVRAALEPQLLTGIRLTALAYVDDASPKLMACSNYETFRIIGPQTGPADTAATEAAWNARESVPFRKVTPKKTQEIDVRPLVPEPLTVTADGEYIRVEVGILRTGRTGVKPTEIWNILIAEHQLPARKDECLIHRTGTYRRADDGTLTPLLVTEGQV